MSDHFFTDLCKRLEHFETPEWAANAILRKEILTKRVIDPCCGTGILSDAALAAGYYPVSIDIHDWGYPNTVLADFLQYERPLNGDTVFMNPPFSLAKQFVEKAFDLGARKVVCFQRFAWYESAKRRPFWEKYPPNRIYICADRATCFRHDIPQEDRDKMGNVPVAHAWFVWERGNASGTLLGSISK